jgi:uncharacterized protein (TIGR00661 family)
MKIFYGVQGTGNGHITRARVMAKALYAAGMEVTFQFSGRPADSYFDMEIFNGHQVRSGLTFNIHKGQVKLLKTAYQAKLFEFVKDVNNLDLSGYDLVISDFEPVTSWAAKKQKKPVLGIGHQYAFKHKVPRQSHDPVAEQVLRHFAPADTSIGLHWHHFGQPIFPPIIETAKLAKQVTAHKIVVYLPFEDQHDVINLLAPFTDFTFHLYSPVPVPSKFDHIICYPLSRDGFQQSLTDCEGVISNSGFELASEALQLGKKILAKPIHGQMEQLANGAALAQLGYGHVMDDLDAGIIEHWLHNDDAVLITYPDTAKVVVQWIKDGMPAMTTDFIESVWDTVNVEHVKKDQRI